MSHKERARKTLARKLRDLEDHLHFLNESLAKLMGGDEAYLKSLAAELRVLACKASGTEGLLWRILDELNISDTIHVHLAENLDRDHPLAQGLQFLFVPVLRAGYGDPRLIPDHHSLREIIKECEALVVSGTGYTHENLIRAVAEQMGSAHEDDRVAPHLIELIGTIISNQSALIHVLMFDAELVLEVGRRALSDAEARGGFVRQNRPSAFVPSQRVSFTPHLQSADFERAATTPPREGTVMFLVNHPHANWRTNSNAYDFGLYSQGGLEVKTTKHPDGTMEVSVRGIGGESIVGTRQGIPNADQSGVMIGLTWNGKEVIFYFCGERVDSVEYRTEG